MTNLEVLDDYCFGQFLECIHQLTGITIAATRKTMVQGRLRKRIRALCLPTYISYLDFVRSSKEEQENFIDLVTTNETSFFRTPRIWEYIEKRFLPKWFEAHKNEVFLAWSSASSSGEEAHSLGILCQAFKENNKDFRYKIVGTDISQEMVTMCKRGEYSGRSIESFRVSRPGLFSAYMESVESSFVVKEEVRSYIHFHKHNLFNSFKDDCLFDLVLCRNVLIYFTPSDQESVLIKILERAKKSSILIIGESESLSHIRTGFNHMEPLIYSVDSR